MKKNKILFPLIVVILLVLIALGIWKFIVYKRNLAPIKIGIVHSLSGQLGHLEQDLVDSLLLAVDEINENGGVLGRRIQPIIADAESKEALFPQKAQELIEHEHIVALFGAWESGARKLIIPVAENANILFFHGINTEGLDISKNFVVTGPTANQSVFPVVTWCFYNLGKRFFIVGGDRIFSQSLNEFVKLQAEMLGATIVGQALLPDDFTDIPSIVSLIKEKQAEVIISFVDNYDINKKIFTALRKEELIPYKVSIVSFSFDAAEIVNYGAEILDETYAIFVYMETIETKENRVFIEKFRKKYGKSRLIKDSMAACYENIYVWAKAVEQAQTTETNAVRECIKNRVFVGPRGPLYIDDMLYSWLKFYIGKIRFDGSVDIVWSSKKAMQPDPYPPYKSKDSWNEFLMYFYKKWHNKWEPYE